MRLKFKEKLSIAFLLVLGLSIFGCIEEPTVDPVKRPYSEIRVVNLSNNVDNMRVLIDDQQVGTLAITGSTNYFDIKSGDRNFKIFNQNGEKVFEKEIPIISYERMTIIFSGFYSTSIDFNTFSNFDISEGEIYVSSTPETGTSNVYIVNAASAVDTFSSRAFNVSATFTPAGGSPRDTVYESVAEVNENPVEFAKSYSIGNTVPGNYTFHFFDMEDSITVDAPPADLTSGMRYYMFIYGNPTSVQFFNNPVVPQPIRSK